MVPVPEIVTSSTKTWYSFSGMVKVLPSIVPVIWEIKILKSSIINSLGVFPSRIDWFSEIKFKSEKEDAYIYLPIWIITVSIIFFGINSSPIIEFSNLSADYLISGYQNWVILF